MIRRHTGMLRAMLMVADAAVALVAAVFVSELRFPGPWLPVFQRVFSPAWVPLIAYALAWVAILFVEGQYRLRVRWSIRNDAVGVMRSAMWLTLLTFTVLFLTNNDDVSRSYLVLLFPTLAIATLATRAAMRGLFMWLRARGRNSCFVLVLGTGPRATEFARQVEKHPELGLRIVGFLGDRPNRRLSNRWQYLGRLTELQRVLHSRVIDEVAICFSAGDWGLVESLAQLCEDEGKIVRIPLEIPQFGTARRFMEDLDGLPVLSFVKGPDRELALAAKRIIDVLAAGLAVVLLSPLLLIVSISIRVADGRPVLFSQERVGLHGRRFKVYKFRTMVRDAERRTAELECLNEVHGCAFKVTDDPRITRLGRILRRTSLDELPQLWNVLRGDMSIVGPRPPLPHEVEEYDIWHRRRLSMKPGMTGLWQVQARRDPEFDRWVEKDLRVHRPVVAVAGCQDRGDDHPRVDPFRGPLNPPDRAFGADPSRATLRRHPTPSS